MAAVALRLHSDFSGISASRLPRKSVLSRRAQPMSPALLRSSPGHLVRAIYCHRKSVRQGAVDPNVLDASEDNLDDLDVAVWVSETRAELSKAIAEFVIEASAECVAARGAFTLAVSGGSLPGILAEGLREAMRQGRKVDFLQWHVFFADERVVPLNDPESNYHLCREQLFIPFGIPEAQVYAIGEGMDPKQCALAYEAMLMGSCPYPPGNKVKAGMQEWLDGTLPRLDTILLGMGPDGHTASIFPGHSNTIRETSRWIVDVTNSPKPPPNRVTFTLPLLKNARQVAFVCAGADKGVAIKEVLGRSSSENMDAGTIQPDKLPAALVVPTRGTLDWFLDLDAAAPLIAQEEADLGDSEFLPGQVLEWSLDPPPLEE